MGRGGASFPVLWPEFVNEQFPLPCSKHPVIISTPAPLCFLFTFTFNHLTNSFIQSDIERFQVNDIEQCSLLHNVLSSGHKIIVLNEKKKKKKKYLEKSFMLY